DSVSHAPAVSQSPPAPQTPAPPPAPSPAASLPSNPAQSRSGPPNHSPRSFHSSSRAKCRYTDCRSFRSPPIPARKAPLLSPLRPSISLAIPVLARRSFHSNPVESAATSAPADSSLAPPAPRRR